MTKKLSLLLILLVIVSANNSFGQIIILSGPSNGSYHQFADDIVKVLGEKEGIKLVNKSTEGSASNIEQLLDPNKEGQMAFVQSDYFGLKKAEDLMNDTHKTESVKVFMPMAKEQMHIFTLKSSGITKMEDLNNTRIAVGTKDQSTFYTTQIIQKRSKIEWFANDINYTDMVRKVMTGSIESAFIIGTAPLPLLDIDPQIMVDNLVLVELTDFNGWAKEYEKDVISADTYPWLDINVPTFSLRTLLVVNMDKLSEADKNTIDKMKASIATHLPYLKEVGYPRWNTVKVP